MTIRQFLKAIIASENVEQELKDFANERLIKLEEQNEKARKKRALKNQEKNAPIKQEILEFLEKQEEGTFVLTSEVAEAVKISNPKASALLTQLEIENFATSKPVQIKGRGTRLVWKLIDNEISE